MSLAFNFAVFRLPLSGKGQRNVELDLETLLCVLPVNYLPYPESGKITKTWRW
jgi:hypothetical protein